LDGDAESDGQPPVFTTSKRGRRVKQASYKESEDEIDGLKGTNDPKNLFDDHIKVEHHQAPDEDDDDEDHPPRLRSGRRRTQNLDDFVVEDDEDKPEDFAGYSLRKRPPKPKKQVPKSLTREDRYRARERRLQKKDEDDQYVDHSDPSSADADGSVDLNEDGMATSDLEVTMEPEPEPEPEPEVDKDGKPYAFRQRTKINYAIPPPLEEMVRPPPKTNGNRAVGGRGALGKRKGPGWSATGAELGRWMGMGGDDSVRVIFFLLLPAVLSLAGLGLSHTNSPQATFRHESFWCGSRWWYARW
jgi:hypothetical protein